jgi:hypothetical protein
MRKQTKSSTLFWAKYFGLALAIVIVATGVIVLKTYNDNKPIPEGVSPPKSLAQGVTDFYSEYRLSSRHPHPEKIGDFVTELNLPEKPLADRLKNMESLQKPSAERWVGEHKFRTFKAGSTLREAITSYAELEGMQLIWELDRDFIVKSQFQMDNDIVGSLYKIAKAIDSNFDGEVRAFICPKQRSLVITATVNDYLTNECTEAKA